MGQTTNTTQVYSPFGSGYVPEAHDPEKPKARRNRGILLVGSLLAVSAAGAIAATTWNRSSPDVWAQEAPSSVLKLPGGFGVDDAVY
jgi:hypothetical protein